MTLSHTLEHQLVDGIVLALSAVRRSAGAYLDLQDRVYAAGKRVAERGDLPVEVIVGLEETAPIENFTNLVTDASHTGSIEVWVPAPFPNPDPNALEPRRVADYVKRDVMMAFREYALHQEIAQALFLTGIEYALNEDDSKIVVVLRWQADIQCDGIDPARHRGPIESGGSSVEQDPELR